MSKYTFINEPDPSNWVEENDSKLTLEFNAVDLSRIVQEFEQFLRGSGFIIDGHLDIVQDEEWSETHGHEDDLDDIDQWFGKKPEDNPSYKPGYHRPIKDDTNSQPQTNDE
jgi:hypothetical protein